MQSSENVVECVDRSIFDCKAAHPPFTDFEMNNLSLERALCHEDLGVESLLLLDWYEGQQDEASHTSRRRSMSICP